MGNTPIYFYGSSVCKISAGGQVALPKRFRDVLPDDNCGLVVLPGVPGCLYVYTYQEFANVRERAKQIATQTNDPEFFRNFMEQAAPLELDTQNRFVLSKELRASGTISGSEILFIGMDTRIEIWHPERREAIRREEAFGEQREQRAREIFGI